jgi:hypothetical protein
MGEVKNLSPNIYLLVPQVQFSPHKQGLQEQLGLFFTSIAFFKIFNFCVI